MPARRAGRWRAAPRARPGGRRPARASAPPPPPDLPPGSWRRDRSPPLPCAGGFPQELARDHHLLDLVRPLADLGQLRVAQVALHVELARVAVAAVDLHGGVA